MYTLNIHFCAKSKEISEKKKRSFKRISPEERTEADVLENSRIRKERFPNFHLVFLEERDLYMAKQLHRIADRLSKEDAGKMNTVKSKRVLQINFVILKMQDVTRSFALWWEWSAGLTYQELSKIGHASKTWTFHV